MPPSLLLRHHRFVWQRQEDWRITSIFNSSRANLAYSAKARRMHEVSVIAPPERCTTLTKATFGALPIDPQTASGKHEGHWNAYAQTPPVPVAEE